MEPKKLVIAMLACLMISSGARAQSYRWHVIRSGTDTISVDTVYGYNYNVVDSWHEVITVGGLKKNLHSSDSGRNTILFFRSTDGGETWKEQNPGLPHFEGDNQDYKIQKIEQIDSLTAVAMADSGTMLKTTDGGDTWVRQNIHTTAIGMFDFDFSDSLHGILLAGNWDTNILVTSDGGANWVRANFQNWYPVDLCHSYGNGSFLVSMYGGETLYRTSDNWTSADSSLSSIISKAELDSEVIPQQAWRFYGADTIVAFGGRESGTNLFSAFITVSTDGGESWAPSNDPDNLVVQLEDMSRLDRNIVFCVGWSQFPRLFSSTNHGVTWAIDTFAYDTIFPYEINGITVTPNGNAIALLGGTMALGLPATSGVTESLAAANGITIYPNPASQTITISSLEARKEAVVTDVLGREVLRGTAPPSGPLTLDISSLPAGVYYASDGVNRAKFLKR